MPGRTIARHRREAPRGERCDDNPFTDPRDACGSVRDALSRVVYTAWTCHPIRGSDGSGRRRGAATFLERDAWFDVSRPVRSRGGERRGDCPTNALDDSRGEETERRRDGETEWKGRWGRGLRGGFWVGERCDDVGF